jgi:hypothetical protein
MRVKTIGAVFATLVAAASAHAGDFANAADNGYEAPLPLAMIAAMALLIGLVVMLKKMGASPIVIVLAALFAGQLLGICIGTCFGQMGQNNDRYDRAERSRNYFDSQDPRIVAHEPGYHPTSPYYTTPQTTVVYGWSAITGALSSAWGAIARYAWPEQYN